MKDSVVNRSVAKNYKSLKYNIFHNYLKNLNLKTLNFYDIKYFSLLISQSFMSSQQNNVITFWKSRFYWFFQFSRTAQIFYKKYLFSKVKPLEYY